MVKALIIFLFTLFTSSSLYTFAQGGWDIDYVPIHLVDSAYAGKDVKLDFTLLDDSEDFESHSFRHLISQEDSITLRLHDQVIQFVEKRPIHVDWGFYDEQYLEGIDYSSTELLRIYHTTIEDFRLNEIKVRLYLEVYPKREKENLTRPVRRWCHSLWMDKKLIGGILIKN